MRKVRTIEMKRLTVEEYREAEKLPLVVILDDIRSMYNIGSVFRTCDAFRVEAVCLCGICQTPPHTEIHKTALGAEEIVSWRYFNTALEAVEELKKAGYMVFSVEQVEHSTKLQTFEPQRGLKYAVVMGNEVKGVHQEVVDASDGCLEIPQLGTKHSMNVSVTAGIIIWHFAKPMFCDRS
jgi:tRNA G18 (ribose-2'-O)-methylase SpoU